MEPYSKWASLSHIFDWLENTATVECSMFIYCTVCGKKAVVFHSACGTIFGGKMAHPHLFVSYNNGFISGTACRDVAP